MIGIDTNVLIRYITQDDEEQAAIASKWIESCSAEAPGWVSVIVLCETV
jgi:predicted nucleic-acid-binding protein